MGCHLSVWLSQVSGGENGIGELWACQVSSREEQLDAGTPVSFCHLTEGWSLPIPTKANSHPEP